MARTLTPLCLAAALCLLAAAPPVAAQDIEAANAGARIQTLAPSAIALYEQGCTAFRSGNYDAAGRAFAQLAPFDQPRFGAHARYLLSRCHHFAGELGEARAGYDAVLQVYPGDKPSPDFAARAALYSGLLLAEQNRHADA